MSTAYHESQLYRIRHSSSHVMAQAVLEMFPEGKFAIGPAIEDGFYYDFDLPRPLTPQDLEVIEARMREIIRQKHPFVYREVSAAEARLQFKDQPYKLELIDNLAAGGLDEDGNSTDQPVQISFYSHGPFTDLCRGPHVSNTQEIPADAIKLLSIAGAYWRGDEKRPMLQRIYGTAFETTGELKEYLAWREEVEKRDHRKLGKQLDLFSVSPELGGGLILWHPNGAMIRHLAEEFCKNEHLAGGYDLVYSPHIGRANLWETSGHLTWYKENMYSSMDIEGQDYYLKPMNCPFHILIYENTRRSYRDLPMRFAEWGTVYRFERGGVLHGLLRVRGFTQDDAHLFCRPDQMPEEIDRVLGFCLHILRSFGFTDFHAYLATRDPQKSAGDPAKWEAPTEALRAALERAEIPYAVDEGGAAFYGPKIDIKIKDALRREWQLSTIQFDFNLPERFNMTYIGEDGQEHQPYMIHRALLGSMERFFGVLIEHYGGAFPVWLAPAQAVIIPIADRHIEFARQVQQQLKASGLRVTIDESSNRMQAKIRDAQNLKIPYMLVVGDREAAEGKANIRLRTGEQKGEMSIDEIRAYIQNAVDQKALI
jgi:threonyl-tRNA synthetase